MLLKEVYNQDYLKLLGTTILAVEKSFDLQGFLKNFSKEDWQEKELNERKRAIAIAINDALPGKNYRQKIEILKLTIMAIPKGKNSPLALMLFPDFVEVFGSEDFDFSMQALEFFTEFGSAEFAVRRFIEVDEKGALDFFIKWSKSENLHVRRLASEGCRPRLPWGRALKSFKKDPTPILPILENLKYDKQAYVAKSVANNLNDISKDNRQIVLDLAAKWQKEKVSEGLIKHALRTLLKRGDKAALKLIGIEDSSLAKNFAIQLFALQKAEVKISEHLVFDFTLENQASNNKIRLEYAVYFLRKNGSHSKKIFQITTKNFAKGVFSFSKKHSLRDMTTRKHYAGRHLISLVANGVELGKKEFYLS